GACRHPGGLRACPVGRPLEPETDFRRREIAANPRGASLFGDLTKVENLLLRAPLMHKADLPEGRYGRSRGDAEHSCHKSMTGMQYFCTGPSVRHCTSRKKRANAPLERRLTHNFIHK